MSYEYLNTANVSDSDTPFVVNAVTREITCKSPNPKVLIQNDHDSERFTFEIPRFIEGRDIGLCNIVQVCYINIDSKTKKTSSGVYTVEDLEVYPFINDVMTCSWLISRNATQYKGVLNFMLRFAYVNDDATVKYAWSTKVFEGVTVAESLESAETFTFEYVDIIRQWKNAVMAEFAAYIDVAVKENVDAANALLTARLDNLLGSLTEGSTTSDAELIDMRVDFKGNSYSCAGEAMRGQATILDNDLNALMQKNLATNPFQPLPVNMYKCYRGSDTTKGGEEFNISKYNAANLEEYASMDDDATNSSYCLGARLVTFLPKLATANNEYVVIIKTDHAISGKVYLGYYMNWAPNNSMWTKGVDLKAGYNVVYIDGNGYFQDGDFEVYRYVYFKSNEGDLITAGVTKFEMYIISSDALFGYIDQVVKEIGENASFAAESENALNSANAGLARLPITRYMSNTASEPTAGAYTLEETSCGYHFAVSEENHVDAGSAKWFQGFVTDLGVKTDVVKETLYLKVVSNDESCTKQELSRLALHNAYYNWNGVRISQGIIKISEVDLSAYADDDHIYLIWGVSAGTNDEPAWNENTCDFTVTLMKLQDGYVLANELIGFNPDDYALKSEVPGVGKKIICWGDSLTAMGGWTTKLASLSGLEVVNCGTGGENSRTIASRQGADCIIIDDLTIPADTTAVQVTDYATKFTTYMGETSSPLLQGGSSHVNPCMLGDIEGTLAWTGSAYNDETGVWTFTRSEAGEEVVINRPTQLITFADRKYNDGTNIHVFFIGTNDGAFDVDEMISRLKLMIDHSKTGEYLVLGLTRIQTEGYKEAFKAAFGRKWLDLHGYLVAYGLEDSGLEATDEDTTAIESDLVPPSLLMDAVHYTETTRELIGIQVYNRLRDLHYFE